uniref:Reversion-inducing cysteine-rich protein with Kazal motifs n=1 Tax=Scleropages formosus TaxID=113540 RepID=A0A8C9U327_SCLFO
EGPPGNAQSPIVKWVSLSLCLQLSIIKSESRLKHLLHRLPSYCPEHMVRRLVTLSFVLNFSGVSKKSDGWVGLGCCELAISVDCRRHCKSVRSPVVTVCAFISQKPLYSCIAKNEMGSLCCGYVGRHTNCREYCQAIFRTDSSPSLSQITTLKEYCESISPQLISCVGNYTKLYPVKSPIDSLYCCDRAEDPSCQAACRRILHTLITEQEIIEALIADCDRQPLPQDPMWQCFLGSAHSPPPSDPDTSPTAKMDCAKLHCCSKANTSLCRSLCQESSTNWGGQTWQEFDQLCEYTPLETELVSCLADVREPCQLGCKDLTYCTNFNHRPTELFRSCNTQADQGAMNDIRLWEKGTIKMPLMNIPVLDISRCLPEVWKAVACVLQIKPCSSKSRSSIICKSDCVDILTQCGDHSKFHEGQTPESICDLLSPIEDPELCIPLERYLTPGSFGHLVEEMIHPCNPNPCPSNHLCEVNRKGCQTGHDCLPNICVPGCKLGEASDVLVHMEALVQVPVRSGPVGCYEVCVCGPSGRLESCAEMPCIDTSKTCIVGGQRKNHGASFKVDCNLCFCFAGDPVCSMRQCLSPFSSEEDRQSFTGLPCGCPDQFVPVCAHNGRTYPSGCVARCVGMQDNQFSFGTCRSRDPCDPNPCQKGQRCAPKRQVCLSSTTQYPCRQYECLFRTLTCDTTRAEPVCDTTHTEHPNLCVLQQRGRNLSYTGHCQEACRKRRPVCGHDGETYGTVCEAHSHRVALDYHGHCYAVGGVSEFTPESGCSSVVCPPLSARGCKPVTPPGACCPLCAGMLRILWNKVQMDVFAKLNREQPVTVHDVLEILRLYVSVPQCDVFGYLSIDSEMVVLVVPVDQQPTALQIELCNKEAEKIDSLISYGSPTLVSLVPLSAFGSSEVKVSALSKAARPPAGPSLLLGTLAVLAGCVAQLKPAACDL